MSYRFMRILVLFDLPVETAGQRHAYTVFHRFLVRSGFIMQQKSVYSKLALNTTAAMAIMGSVRANKPEEGLIQMLTITEKQYARMELVLGSVSSELIDSTDRLVVL